MSDMFGEEDAGLRRLMEHCALLNRLERRAIQWFVTGEAPNRRVESRPISSNRA